MAILPFHETTQAQREVTFADAEKSLAVWWTGGELVVDTTLWVIILNIGKTSEVSTI